MSPKHAPLPLLLLITACSISNIEDQTRWETPTGKADSGNIVDQRAADTTVLRASAEQAIGFQGQPGFQESECDVVDDFNMNCTAAFEARYDAPALHQVIVPRNQHNFMCRLLEVETVSKNAAEELSQGIGFFYQGYSYTGPWNGHSAIRFIDRSELKVAGAVTLKGGDAATVHRFIGLANCWLGSMTGSANARYRFRPFMAFESDEGTLFRNWDEVAEDYTISTGTTGFDRSSEL